MQGNEITLRVHRFDPGASAPARYDQFTVPFSKGLTVLDALIYVYENVDSSLSFRWSCKNVQCGTCGLLTNGKAVLACERVILPGEAITVDPFPLPIIKDVVTDFAAIEDKRVRMFSKLTPTGRPDRLSPEEVAPLISLHKCLDCHVCDVVCPLNKGKEKIEPNSFLPSDLVQLASMVFNKREGEDRTAAAYSKKLYQCLTCGACVGACPVDIDIVNDAVEKLRQDFMKRDLSPYRKLFAPQDWVERWVELKGRPFLEDAQEVYSVSGAQGQVGLFVGCVMNRRQQDLTNVTIKVLNKAGFDVVVPKGQLCCGQPLMRLGMTEEARDLLRRNISVFEEAGISRVVTACPDCSFAFTQDYERLVGDGDRRPRFAVSDAVSLISSPPADKSKSFACHNPCYLSKQGINLADELGKKGFTIGEVLNDCCGAGGGVYFTNPAIADEIGRKTLQAMKSDTLVTGCPFCKEQFQKVIGQGKKLMHYVELLGG